MPEELQTEVCNIVHKAVIKPSQEKEMQKGKWLSEEALHVAEKRKEVKDKGERERYVNVNAEFQRMGRTDKVFLSDHPIVIIWVMKIFFVQFFCVFLPPLNISCFCLVHTISVLYCAYLLLHEMFPWYL